MNMASPRPSQAVAAAATAKDAWRLSSRRRTAIATPSLAAATRARQVAPPAITHDSVGDWRSRMSRVVLNATMSAAGPDEDQHAQHEVGGPGAAREQVRITPARPSSQAGIGPAVISSHCSLPFSRAYYAWIRLKSWPSAPPRRARLAR